MVVRKVFTVLLFCVGVVCLWNCKSIIYGIRQGSGQMHIVLNKEPIEEFIQKKEVSDLHKERLLLAEEIKKFAFDSLGIFPNDNYSEVYDQKGKPAMYVVTACKPYALESYLWKFPFFGKFPYKGYFKKKFADKEASKLKEEGWDTEIGEVNAWSTLGWFRDPIMTSMLEKSPGQLARVLIHELTHGTLYVKNDVTFNENLATFVGDKGARLFLVHKFGVNSNEVAEFDGFLNDMVKFRAHMVKGAKELSDFYKNTHIDTVKIQKQQKIAHIITSLDTIEFYHHRNIQKIIAQADSLNNTFFTDFLTYREQQNDLERVFQDEFHGDFEKYFEYLKNKYPSL